MSNVYRAATLFGLIIALVGCRGPQPEEIYEPENWQGEVDSSLPKETQEKQDALIRLFAAIQQVGIENYQWDCPHIQFNESFDEFFGDTVGIHRWEWAGEPNKDVYLVRIYLEQDDPTAEKTVEERRYKVLRSGRGYSIKRVDPASDA